MGGRHKRKNSPASRFKVLIEKTLVLAGKPIFLLFFAFLFLVFQIFLFPLALTNYLKVTKVKLSEKLQRKASKKKARSKFSKLKGLMWNLGVFFLALRKLPGKLIGRKKYKFNLPSFPKIRFLKLAGYLVLFLAILSIAGGVLFWQYILKDLPSPSDLSERKLNVSTKIYDRRRELLYTIFKDQKRTPVKLEQIPIEVKLATVAAEDKDFYTHSGFSIRGIARAIIKDLREGRLTGGSTITQQLVKNALLSPS